LPVVVLGMAVVVVLVAIEPEQHPMLAQGRTRLRLVVAGRWQHRLVLKTTRTAILH
jgi:hypothetical protein